MGKLSNDSDSDKRRNKRSHPSKSRRRSSSSESGSSRYKKTSRKHSTRSHSKDRSYRSRRSRSGSHYKSKHRGSRRRSHSRDRHRTRRSRSKDYIREYVSKKRSSSSSSASPTSDSVSSNDATKMNVKIDPKQDFDIPPMDSEVLEEINTDSFEQKSFSSKKKLPNTIVIDLKKQTITVPELEPVEPDSIFHHNLFLSDEARTEKWVKELYIYRQKALQQGAKNNS